ncbi:hypothetical protein ATO46_06865 [Aeromonas schubertii]|nr:hypothetical protein ATO46_06865 [Aeromonas schubertii]
MAQACSLLIAIFIFIEIGSLQGIANSRPPQGCELDDLRSLASFCPYVGGGIAAAGLSLCWIVVGVSWNRSRPDAKGHTLALKRGGQKQALTTRSGEHDPIDQPAVTAAPLPVLWICILIGILTVDGIANSQPTGRHQGDGFRLRCGAGWHSDEEGQAATLFAARLCGALCYRADTKCDPFAHHGGGQVKALAHTQRTVLAVTPA